MQIKRKVDSRIVASRVAAGMQLVKKPVARVEAPVVREGTRGRVLTFVPAPVRVLPRVWAVADASVAVVPTHDDKTVVNGAPKVLPFPTHDDGTVVNGAPGVSPVEAGAPAARLPVVEVAFYRKYTEAMLRRYMRLSMQAGRVPSLMGRELFRGHVSSYRMHSFEDVVIFCYDMEKCLGRLDAWDKELVKRIGLQQYSQGEAAAALGISPTNCALWYFRAVDRLTKMLLEAKLLEPLKSCQEGSGSVTEVKH